MIGPTLRALAGAAGLMLGLLGASLLTPTVMHAAQGTPCPEATDTELEEIARGWAGALSSHDLSLLEAIAAPDIVHQSALVGSVAGIDAIQASQQALLDGFPDFEATINLILTDAPYVVSHWTATGTHTGVFQGIEPGGDVATWDGLNVFKVECGQIVESWTYLDQIGRLQQIGALPADPAAETPAEMAEAGGTPAACPAATDAEMSHLLETWWGEIWSGDLARLDAITTDDVIHHWATGPDSVGQEAQAARIGGWTEAIPDMQYTWGDIVIDGEYAAATWQATGTQTGEYMGNPASGKTAAWGGANIFRVECGQIAEVWSEMDVLSFRAQLAADEAATPAP